MFTVLHKYNGKERVFKTVGVHYLDFKDHGDSGGVHLTVGPDEGGPGVECGHIVEGDVFVMNDHGATVAKWFMGPKTLRNTHINPDGSITYIPG